VTKFDLSKLQATLNGLADEFEKNDVKVGIPGNVAYEGENGPSIAFIATIQNYGAPGAKIPARPFMSPTFEAKKDEWTAILADGVKQTLQGKMVAYEALDRVGTRAATDIQKTIKGITSPALSPVTVLLRKWRKSGRKITGSTVGEAAAAIAAGVDPGTDNKPLNDTGQLYYSVRWAVSPKSEEDIKSD
jgi:hypothetical protein